MATIYWHGRRFEDGEEFEQAYMEHQLDHFSQWTSPYGPLLVPKALPPDKVALIQQCVDASQAESQDAFVVAVAQAFDQGGWQCYDPVATLVFLSLGGGPHLRPLLDTLSDHKSAKVRERIGALIEEDVEADPELIAREVKLAILRKLFEDRSSSVRTRAINALLTIGNCYKKTDREILQILDQQREQEKNTRVQEEVEFAIRVLRQPMIHDVLDWGRELDSVLIAARKVIG